MNHWNVLNDGNNPSIWNNVNDQNGKMIWMFTWNVLYDTNGWHVQNYWNSEMFEMVKWSERLKRWEWLTR